MPKPPSCQNHSLPFQNQTLVQRAAQALIEAHCHPVLVITGRDHEAITAQLLDTPAAVLQNPDWKSGLATSIQAGLKALPSTTPAILITLCDQPFITAAHLTTLIHLYQTAGKPAAASRYGDFGGPPAIFSQSLFPDLNSLKGDEGAKRILRRLGDQVVWLSLPEAATDIDRPEDLAHL